MRERDKVVGEAGGFDEDAVTEVQRLCGRTHRDGQGAEEVAFDDPEAAYAALMADYLEVVRQRDGLLADRGRIPEALGLSALEREALGVMCGMLRYTHAEVFMLGFDIIRKILGRLPVDGSATAVVLDIRDISSRLATVHMSRKEGN